MEILREKEKRRRCRLCRCWLALRQRQIRKIDLSNYGSASENVIQQ